MDVITAIPDPLRRFVLTPHRGELSPLRGGLSIESNDVEFTKQLLECFRGSLSNSTLGAIKFLKLVVEHSLGGDGENITLVDSGALRTVLRGTRTMLIYDSESRMVFAFLAQEVSCKEFYERLLPIVMPGIPLPTRV